MSDIYHPDLAPVKWPHGWVLFEPGQAVYNAYTLGKTPGIGPPEAELRREIEPQPRSWLHDAQLTAIAVYVPTRGKDFLFFTDHPLHKVLQVHLTFSIERNPTWPWRTAYPDLDAFLNAAAEDK